MNIDVVTNNQIRPAWAVQAVDDLLKKMGDKPMWEGVDFLVKTLYKIRPDYMNGFEVTQEDRNQLLKDTGATDDNNQRHLLSVPPMLMDLVTYFYESDVEENPKRFFREFARRYPQFRKAEKI